MVMDTAVEAVTRTAAPLAMGLPTAAATPATTAACSLEPGSARKQFQPSAAIVTLDRNYRSTVPILNAANAVIALAKERFTKDLWSDRSSEEKPALVAVRDDAAQAHFVVERGSQP